MPHPPVILSPALYCLEAMLVLARPQGERRVSIDRFIVGPGRTELADDELLLAIDLPLVPFALTYYRKVGTRQANALSKLSFLGLCARDGERISDLRLAFGAVAPTVVRSPELEQMFLARPGADLTAVRRELTEGYAKLISPIDDQRSTAGYRRTVALNLLSGFLEACFGQPV